MLQQERIPMIKLMRFLFLVCFIGFSMQGCTYREWYEGFRERQRQNCYRYSSQDDIEKCLVRTNSMTYDQYEKAREESKKQNK